jgi:hypothetical protein
MNVNAGEGFSLRCFTHNTGAARWLHHSPHDVGVTYVGAHLYDENNKLLNLEFGRSPLEKGIEPDEEAVCYLNFCIAEPGRYRIEIDMVSEHVCWFESLGFKPPVIEVVVI